MNEILPIFPLQLVAFPGEDLNLHIFEPRYLAMLDDTLGPAVFAATDFKQQGRTIDLHTHFVRPAFPGKIRGKGKVTRLGKTVAFMEGQLFDPDEKLIARATGSAMLFDFKT